MQRKRQDMTVYKHDSIIPSANEHHLSNSKHIEIIIYYEFQVCYKEKSSSLLKLLNGHGQL